MRTPGGYSKVSLRLGGFGERDRSGQLSVPLSKGCAGKRGGCLQLVAVSREAGWWNPGTWNACVGGLGGAPVLQVYKGELGSLS